MILKGLLKKTFSNPLVATLTRPKLQIYSALTVQIKSIRHFPHQLFQNSLKKFYSYF